MKLKSGWTQFGGEWRRRREDFDKIRESGQVLISKEPAHPHRIYVICPYSEDFVQGAHTLNGRWRQRTQRWSFNLSTLPAVRALAIKVYGRDKVRG